MIECRRCIYHIGSGTKSIVGKCTHPDHAGPRRSGAASCPDLKHIKLGTLDNPVYSTSTLDAHAKKCKREPMIVDGRCPKCGSLLVKELWSYWCVNHGTLGDVTPPQYVKPGHHGMPTFRKWHELE